MPATPQPPAAQTDQQDVVNQLLAGAMQATEVLNETRRAAALLAAEQPEAAANLTDAATAWAETREAMLRAADELATREPR